MKITGTQARASDVAAALEKVATAVAEATAVVADLNAALTHDQEQSELAKVAETAHRRETRTVPSSVVDLEPDLAFADWRCEVLNLL
jgi:ABC-type transporter Mla subunit MlaD